MCPERKRNFVKLKRISKVTVPHRNVNTNFWFLTDLTIHYCATFHDTTKSVFRSCKNKHLKICTIFLLYYLRLQFFINLRSKF